MSEDFKPGDRVVIFRSHRHANGRAHIKPDVVERVLKRDIVLASGERFNKHRPTKSGGAWDSPTELLRADDPRVERARQANDLEQHVHRLGVQISAVEAQLRRERNPGAAIAALRELVDNYS